MLSGDRIDWYGWQSVEMWETIQQHQELLKVLNDGIHHLVTDLVNDGRVEVVAFHTLTI